MARPALARTGIPLYIQLASLIRRRIQAGQWRAGDQLPTLEQLIDEFKVARVTVRQALGLLADEGLVSRQRGRGSFVLKAPLNRPWFSLQTSLSSLTDVAEHTDVLLLASTPSVRELPLGPGDGQPAPAYQYMRRVHSRDGIPYSVLNIYVDRRLYRRVPGREWERTPVIPLLLKLGDVAFSAARQTITINTADDEAAELLKIPANAPVAEIRRVIADQAGTVVYYGEIIYRGDLVRIDISLM